MAKRPREQLDLLSEMLLRVWEEPLEDGTNPVRFANAAARKAFKESVTDLLETVYGLAQRDERRKG